MEILRAFMNGGASLLSGTAAVEMPSAALAYIQPDGPTLSQVLSHQRALRSTRVDATADP